MTLSERAKRIRLIILDVDGVLTDCRIVYGNWGNNIKFFDARDGLGVTLWWRSGGKSAILTAKRSWATARRAKDMHIDRVYQGAGRKLETFQRILEDFNIPSEEIAYMGDDLIDIPVLKRVGLAACVPEAVSEVKDVVHYVTQKPGGRGAVRELTDMLLKEQGKWHSVTEKYYN